MHLLFIFLGGGLGAVARWSIGWLSKMILGVAFPYGTLVANVLGAFLIGMAYGWLTKQDSATWFAPLLITGFLGGFTTFSSFSYETLFLFQKAYYLKALLNIFFNVTLCLLAVLVGTKLTT
ncbi:MAG: fluoride efflux transporter CrcB [Thermonemataceae bacterium]|mgnify:CR=1 FL=1